MFLYGFSSCTCLYEWLSISFEWVFVTYMFVRMTIHFLVYGSSSCTFLYEGLSISFQRAFVMYMYVRMTIHFFWMGFRHLDVRTNDYTFPCVWVFVMHISVRMTIHFFWMGFLNLHVCTNDYHFFLNGLSSFTFLYEWLPSLFEWIIVMHIPVRMTTISFWMDFRHAHFCTKDYQFVSYQFSSCIFCAMTFHILCIWIFIMHNSVRMNFHILLVFHDVCNALQRVNSMEQWRITNNIIMYIGFWPCA